MTIGLPEIAAVIGLGTSLAGASKQKAAGQIGKQRYETQAEQERIKYSFEANKARMQTAEIVRRGNEQMASANAGSYAMGVDPSSFGFVINTQLLSPLVNDIIVSDVNAQLAEKSGQAQFEDLMLAGQQAALAGGTAALGTAASGFMNFASMAPFTPRSTSIAPTTSSYGPQPLPRPSVIGNY